MIRIESHEKRVHGGSYSNGVFSTDTLKIDYRLDLEPSSSDTVFGFRPVRRYVK